MEITSKTPTNAHLCFQRLCRLMGLSYTSHIKYDRDSSPFSLIGTDATRHVVMRMDDTGNVERAQKDHSAKNTHGMVILGNQVTSYTHDGLPDPTKKANSSCVIIEDPAGLIHSSVKFTVSEAFAAAQLLLGNPSPVKPAVNLESLRK